MTVTAIAYHVLRLPAISQPVAVDQLRPQQTKYLLQMAYAAKFHSRQTKVISQILNACYTFVINTRSGSGAKERLHHMTAWANHSSSYVTATATTASPTGQRLGCTKTRNGEIRNGKWGNAKMENGEWRTKAWPPGGAP